MKIQSKHNKDGENEAMIKLCTDTMKRQRKNEENSKDMISELPDHVLLHILSFSNVKEVVQTSVLSKRWKSLWKCLDTLKISSSHFRTLKNFTNFVSKMLSLRDASRTIHTLDIYRHGVMEPRILKKIIKYTFSHKVQQLAIDVNCNFENFPTRLFSCQALTSLHLCVYHEFYSIVFPNSLNLPALTNLSLEHVCFRSGDDGRVDPFSGLSKLNSLKIKFCDVVDDKNLCISSTKLFSLAIIKCSIKENFGIELSTPSLHSFDFNGSFVLKLCGSKNILSSIKHVNINLTSKRMSAENSPLLLNWLVQLATIESLTISSKTLKVLSLVPDLLKYELSSLCNLKLLEVKKRKHSSVIPDGIVDFLLQNSPSAKVDIKVIDA